MPDGSVIGGIWGRKAAKSHPRELHSSLFSGVMPVSLK